MLSGSADPIRRLRILRSERAEVAWSEGLDIGLPESVIASSDLEPAIRNGSLIVPGAARVDPTAVAVLRERAAFTPTPPASSRLPISYRAVPGPLRRVIARAVGRRQRSRSESWAAFPGWPLDLSVDFLADLAMPSPLQTSTPVILTHDIDSVEGLENLVDRFLPIEEAHGGSSTNFIVPCAWPLDHGRLRETRKRGHDLGIHGYDHANRTPFAAVDVRRERLKAGRQLADQFEMVGYRAPSLLRTRELMTDLEGMYRFDSSVPTSGGLFPVPNNGCATARPFRFGNLVEIPVSMPRDGSLQFLGHTPVEILALWQWCADRIARANGVVVLLTHCEDHFSGGPQMLAVYQQFLDWLASDGRFSFARASTIDASS
jgi:peptidoglycan/xylan/chitin deacetylase (PgdA/CDA1 family)